MRIDEIYQRRFKDSEPRRQMWQVLTEQFFQAYVGEDDTVLDVPCGYGEFINHVACRKKYGLDINPDARQHVGEDVEFLEASSTKIPLGPDTLDKIFVSNFFEHLTREDIEATVREFYRVLKPDGQVLVLQPNIRYAHRDYWMFFDHITPIDDRALEEVFSIIGFRLRHRVLKFLPFTAQGRLPVNPLFVSLYLRIRPLWLVLGRQTFMVLEKSE